MPNLVKKFRVEVGFLWGEGGAKAHFGSSEFSARFEGIFFTLNATKLALFLA